MTSRRHVDLTTGSITGHILRMTPPMAVAFFATMAFNLADTWFVSRLGTQALAAMGFTFPVVMLLHALTLGIGLGTSACVSRAIGKGDHDRVQHLATYSLLLALLAASALAVAGWVFMPRLFHTLGATPETLPLTMDYMRIWFLFVPVTSLPMVGNNAIRATGDTLRPSIIMCTAALLNVVLDPIFIFGWGPVPAMGIRGAALATGLARLVTLVWAFWLMHYRCHLLTRRWTGWSALFDAWRDVLHVAIPAAATNVLMPVTAGIITRLIAGFGEFAVAATAAGQRIEIFSYVVPIAMGTALVPIIGQNWGAGRVDRVREAWRWTTWSGIVYGLLCLLIAIPAAGPVARCFSDDPRVTRLITHYLWILLSGALLLHVTVHTGFALNAIQRPLHASLLTVVRAAVFVLPLCWFGSRHWGVHGIYGGIAIAHALAGLVAVVWFRRILAGIERDRHDSASEQASPDHGQKDKDHAALCPSAD